MLILIKFMADIFVINVRSTNKIKIILAYDVKYVNIKFVHLAKQNK
jgi:hypothetical protein